MTISETNAWVRNGVLGLLYTSTARSAASMELLRIDLVRPLRSFIFPDLATLNETTERSGATRSVSRGHSPAECQSTLSSFAAVGGPSPAESRFFH